jgi:hypothetical protein
LSPRIAFDIAAWPALPAVAETAHPVPDIEKKRLRGASGMLTNVDIQAAQSNAPQPRLIVLIVFIKCIV